MTATEHMQMNMKSILTALTLTTALTVPALASAKPVTFTAQIANYWGPNTYLAMYVTDSSGKYVGSLWMAGTRSNYYQHLSQWYRASGGNMADINGITGASIGPGRQLKVTLNLSDALFDAGYTLHIDAAAENLRESPDDVKVALTKAGAGKAVTGNAYVTSFSYSM